MDKIDELLTYIQRTNPQMTRDRLIEELGKSDYSAKSLFETFRKNFILN